MKSMFIVVVMICLIAFTGCSTTASRTQGLNNSCALYAIANAIEIQEGRNISREERLAAWRNARKSDHGTTFQEAMSSAARAGWVPAGSWLKIVDSVDAVGESPLVCSMGNHAATILSASKDYVVYLDPAFVDPISMKRRTMDGVTRGFYYQIVLSKDGGK